MEKTQKIYRKGTKIRFFCCTHDPQSKEWYDDVLEQDMTESELEAVAKEYLESAKEPEYWFHAEGEKGFDRIGGWE